MLHILNTVEMDKKRHLRREHVEPILEDDSDKSQWLTLINNHTVTSRLLVNECDFVAVHISYFNGDSGGQFYRYYLANDENVFQRVTIREVTLIWRMLLIEAYLKLQEAERWVKPPFKSKK